MTFEEAIRKAMDRYLAGGYQDALDILYALPPEEKKKLMLDEQGARLATRLTTTLGGNASETSAYIGLVPFKAQTGNTTRDLAGVPDWVARKAKKR